MTRTFVQLDRKVPFNNEGSLRVYKPEADLDSDGRVNGRDLILASFTGEADLYDLERFTYDASGNRTSLTQNGDLYSYRYGVRNRLESVMLRKAGQAATAVFAEYDYDANGNTVRRRIHGSGVTVETWTYDVLNRLTESVSSSGKSVKHYYDTAGNRFLKVNGDGSLSLYLRHGALSVAMDLELPPATDSSKKGTINRYVLSGDLLAGRITTAVNADNSTVTTSSWYHLDHLNSTKAVTDASATLEVLYEYRAFGEQLKRLDQAGEDTADSAKYSYGGKELDDETNLYYFNARFYDATTGRFINVDPIQDGWNWYEYCRNNPLSYVDPTGLTEENNIEHRLTTFIIPFSMTYAIRDDLNNKFEGKVGPSISGAIKDKAIKALPGKIVESSKKFLGPIFFITDLAKKAQVLEAHQEKEAFTSFMLTMLELHGKEANSCGMVRIDQIGYQRVGEIDPITGKPLLFKSAFRLTLYDGAKSKTITERPFPIEYDSGKLVDTLRENNAREYRPDEKLPKDIPSP